MFRERDNFYGRDHIPCRPSLPELLNKMRSTKVEMDKVLKATQRRLGQSKDKLKAAGGPGMGRSCGMNYRENIW